jgi:hypothetical protein
MSELSNLIQYVNELPDVLKYVGAVLSACILLEIVLMFMNMRASSWTHVRGELINSDVSFTNSTRMEEQIEYTYKVGAEEYKSHKIAYGSLGKIFILLKKFYIDEKNLTVYYNPNKPEKSVLIPGIRLFHFIEIAFIVGILILVFNYY